MSSTLIFTINFYKFTTPTNKYRILLLILNTKFFNYFHKLYFLSFFFFFYSEGMHYLDSIYISYFLDRSNIILQLYDLIFFFTYNILVHESIENKEERNMNLNSIKARLDRGTFCYSLMLLPISTLRDQFKDSFFNGSWSWVNLSHTK